MYPESDKIKLIRSNNTVIAGICEGLGQSFKVNPHYLRAFFIITTLFFGMSLVVYPLLWIILPKEGLIHEHNQEKILGVCYRLSSKLKVELAIIRLIAVSLAVLSFGSVILAYFALFLYFELKAPSQKTF